MASQNKLKILGTYIFLNTLCLFSLVADEYDPKGTGDVVVGNGWTAVRGNARPRKIGVWGMKQFIMTIQPMKI
jgi:hypothetical protein